MHRRRAVVIIRMAAMRRRIIAPGIRRFGRLDPIMRCRVLPFMFCGQTSTNPRAILIRSMPIHTIHRVIEPRIATIVIAIQTTRDCVIIINGARARVDTCLKLRHGCRRPGHLKSLYGDASGGQCPGGDIYRGNCANRVLMGARAMANILCLRFIDSAIH